MKTRSLILIAILIVGLCGCSKQIKEGEVLTKEFHPQQTTVILMPLVMGTGKTVTTTLIPIPFLLPDSWSITFKACDGDKWRERTVWVSREVYDAVNKGDWYVMGDKDMNEQPKVRQ